MFRFTSRNMLWLTVLVALVLYPWLPIDACARKRLRRSCSASFQNRASVVPQEQEPRPEPEAELPSREDAFRLLLGQDVEFDASGERVTKISLVNVALTMEMLAAVVALEPDSIYILECDLPATGMGVLSRLQSLRELYIADAPLDDRAAKPLWQLARLEKLHLYGCPISDASAGDLSRLKRLEELSIGETRFTIAGIKRVLSHTKAIRTMEISALGLTREQLWTLRREFPGIKLIDLTQN